MAQLFCTRCGSPLEADDAFCGSCGAPVRPRPADPERETMAADVLAEDEPPQPGSSPVPEDDLLADWDLDLEEGEEEVLVPPDEAATEAIGISPSEGTEAMPRVADTPPEPYVPPAAPTPEPAGRLSPPPREGGGGFPLGATVALLGAVAVILSSVLDWGRGPLGSSFPRGIPARTLLDPEVTSGVSLGIVLLLLGTAGALLALLTMVVPFLKFLRRLAGLVALAVPAMYVYRLTGAGILDGPGEVVGALGHGVYFAAVGAVVQIVAGKWFRR